MAKDTCPAGKRWDNLVKFCVKVRGRAGPRAGPSTAQVFTNLSPAAPPPPPVVTQARARTVAPVAPTTEHAPPEVMLSLALWVIVVLTTLGSILALLLWLIMYRRRSKLRSALEVMETGQEPLQKTANGGHQHPPPRSQGHSPAVVPQGGGAGGEGGGGDPPPCPQLHRGPQEDPEQEESFISCWDPTLHAGAEQGGGLPERSPLREHRIPLPATELGGTALVTTKTV